MRAGAVIVGLALTIAMAASCKSDSNSDAGTVLNGDATYEAPPDRSVVDVTGPLFPLFDASTMPDMARFDTAAADRQQSPDVAIDSRPDMAAGSCELVRQNCARATDGCYRAGSGRAACQASGVLAADSELPCDGDPDCERGSICVNDGSGFATCRRVCNVQNGCANSRQVCRALAGYDPAGYCN